MVTSFETILVRSDFRALRQSFSLNL